MTFYCQRLSAQANCEFRKSENDISVYACERTDSDLKAIYAEFPMKISAAEYVDIITDISSYPEWNIELQNVRLIERPSQNELIYYFEAIAPWPIKDRYAFLRLKVRTDESSGTTVITQEIVDELMTGRADKIGVKEFSSRLMIVEKPGSPGSAEFRLNVDPAGGIPTWFTNIILVRMPINTYTNIFKRGEYLRSQTEVKGKK